MKRALLAASMLLVGCSSTSTATSSTVPTTTPPALSTAPAATSGTQAGSTTTTTLPSSSEPCGRAASPPAAYDHVIWIWMENHTATQVLAKANAPYVSGLSQQCGRAADYRSVGRPSLPNYIGATSGDTWGIGDDAGPGSHVLTVDNIFRQVRATNRRAMSYQEAMPANCSLHSGGTYAVKHNPAAYYQGADDRAACLADDVPLDAFGTALTNGSLPAFSFITPDLCHDTHDCSVTTGDQWLSGFLPVILGSDTYRAGTTAIFLVWDEPTPMPFISIAPSVRVGSVLTAKADHYSLLRTTEEMLGITAFLGHATDASSMRASFNL